MQKNYGLKRRVGFALAGWAEAFRYEQNFRLQCLAAGAMFVFMAVLQPGLIWWAVVVLCVVLVLAAELLNTALERTLDGLHPEHALFVQKAKDCAAGAVLMLSCGTVFVFLFIVLAHI